MPGEPKLRGGLKHRMLPMGDFVRPDFRPGMGAPLEVPAPSYGMPQKIYGQVGCCRV